jgi:hypothetical protein
MDLSLSELPSGDSRLRHFRSSFGDYGVWIGACIAYPGMGRIADLFWDCIAYPIVLYIDGEGWLGHWCLVCAYIRTTVFAA